MCLEEHVECLLTKITSLNASCSFRAAAENVVKFSAALVSE